MDKKNTRELPTMTPGEVTAVLNVTAMITQCMELLNACGLNTEQIQTLWFMTPENVVISYVNAVNAKGSNEDGTQSNGLKLSLQVIAKIRRINLPPECDIKQKPNVGAN